MLTRSIGTALVLTAAVMALSGGGCSSSSGGGGFPIRQFTSWDDINPGETVVINGNVVHANYQTDLNTGFTNAGPTQSSAAEARLTYDNNSNLVRVDIDAGGASVDFNENQGDDIGLVFGNLIGGAISANGEEIGLWAEPDGLGFNYQTFGVWLTGYNTGAGVAAAGSFGARTPDANVPGAGAGVLTYNGAASGFAVDAAGIPFLVISSSEVVVDFGDGTFNFETTGSLKDNLVDAFEFAFVGDPDFNLAGAGNIVGSSLEGNVATAGYDLAGDVDAWLYGVDASEVGGLFDLVGADGRYVGSFGAVD